MRRGRYLDAREALDYGLLDEISTHPMSHDDARLEDTAAGLDAQGGQLFPPLAAKDSFAAPRTRPGDREKEDDGLSLGRASDRSLAG